MVSSTTFNSCVCMHNIPHHHTNELDREGPYFFFLIHYLISYSLNVILFEVMFVDVILFFSFCCCCWCNDAIPQYTIYTVYIQLTDYYNWLLSVLRLLFSTVHLITLIMTLFLLSFQILLVFYPLDLDLEMQIEIHQLVCRLWIVGEVVCVCTLI